MHARHFGELHVRGEALLFIFRHRLRIEVVIEVARHHVGVGPIRARAARHRKPALPRHAMNSVRELLSERTLRDLAADLPDLRRLQACRRAKPIASLELSASHGTSIVSVE